MGITDTSSKQKKNIVSNALYRMGHLGTAENGRSFSGCHQNDALFSESVHNYATVVCWGLDSLFCLPEYQH